MIVECPVCGVGFSPGFDECPACHQFAVTTEQKSRYFRELAEDALEGGRNPAEVRSILMDAGLSPAEASSIVDVSNAAVGKASLGYLPKKLAIALVLLPIVYVFLRLLALMASEMQSP